MDDSLRFLGALAGAFVYVAGCFAAGSAAMACRKSGLAYFGLGLVASPVVALLVLLASLVGEGASPWGRPAD